ncbi:MAG: hypothetical protein HY678_00740 [Chloroflexi bacterium]|nr:hypothetical protein [Chloroflexota bacterium]
MARDKGVPVARMPTTDKDELTEIVPGYGHTVDWEPCARADLHVANPLPEDSAPVAVGWYRMRCPRCQAIGVSGPAHFYGVRALFQECAGRA